MPLIPGFWKWRQELQKFEVVLGYVLYLILVWAT